MKSQNKQYFHFLILIILFFTLFLLIRIFSSPQKGTGDDSNSKNENLPEKEGNKTAPPPPPPSSTPDENKSPNANPENNSIAPPVISPAKPDISQSPALKIIENPDEYIKSVLPSYSPSPSEDRIWKIATAEVLRYSKIRSQTKFPDLGLSGTSITKTSSGYSVKGYFISPNSSKQYLKSEFECPVFETEYGYEASFPKIVK